MQDDESKRGATQADGDKKPTAREAIRGPVNDVKRSFAAVQLPKLELPQAGGGIKGLGETFKMNPATGTVGFTIPLPFTPHPRPGAATPDVSLSYDSGSGNGIFGAGWSVGIPQITRKTDKKIPEYLDSEDSDIFLLAGAEDLVPYIDPLSGLRHSVSVVLGDLSTQVTERFVPRVEGLFARIERITITTAAGLRGDVYWKVLSRDNVTSTFGLTTASRIADPTLDKRIYAWLLTRVEDGLGNFIDYEYVAEDLVNVARGKPSEHPRHQGYLPISNRYPKRIKYGNAVHNTPSNYKFEIVFDYGDHPTSSPTPTPSIAWPSREDPFSSFKAGFDMRTYRLCRRVLMFHHFTEIAATPTLVRALELTYDHQKHMTKLSSATVKGFDVAGTPKPLPALSFTYASDVMSKSVKSLDINALTETYPRSALGSTQSGPPRAQWIDLDGEGIPGVLIDHGAGIKYQRNLGGGKLAHARTLKNQPSIARGQNTQLVDLDGISELAMVTWTQSGAGFHPRRDDGWGDFTPFKSMANVNFDDPNLRFIDLNGDGIEDILITRGDHLIYYPSLGKKGFGSPQRIALSSDVAQAPRVVFADHLSRVFLADMTGDGLTDIVRVTHAGVTYWPNMGHGKFGAEIRMDNSPRMDPEVRFNTNRIKLVDLDGTGTADMVYIHHEGLRIYRNQSGNRFDDAWVLTGTVPFGWPSMQIVDLFGTGTPCLVWSPEPAADSRYAMYLDPMSSKRPHLLERVDNHMGREVKFQYAASTKFYLADRRVGKMWVEKLPFPVQVCERIETYDAIRKARLVSTYTFHHGHYDPHEREFRGFGRVEQRDAESFDADHGQGLFPTYPVTNGESPQPPALTKTWFHTGGFLNGGIAGTQYQSEYWAGDTAAPPSLTAIAPTGLGLDELREAARALKGSTLRQEIYSEDGTGLAGIPYQVIETQTEVRKLQPRQQARVRAGQTVSRPDLSGVFFAIPRETRTFNYERVANDPRVTQEMMLQVDAYGTPTRTAAIAYRRRATSSLAEQNVTHCIVSETDVIHLDNATNGRRLAIPHESRAYHLTGLTDVTSPVVHARATIDANFTSAASINYEVAPTTGLQKRLIQREKVRYHNTNSPGTLHPFGQADPRALAQQSFLLDLTDGLITAYVPGYIPLSTYKSYAGYQTLAGEPGYWIPSDIIEYNAALFFLPSRTLDVFGASTNVYFDTHGLMLVQVLEVLGNSTTATYDYRALAPNQITDPNGNRTQIAYDELGMPTKIAVMGKITESLGDTLSVPTIEYSYDLDEWDTLQKPIWVKTRAREVHGGLVKFQEKKAFSDGGGAVVMAKAQAEPATPGGAARWVGTGRTVLNNKGNPIKQYEPYFSNNFDYEDEDDIVATGVTPVMTYDALGRLVRTDLPNGSYRRAEWTAWQTTQYDENDTVTESGNLWRAARQPAYVPTPSAAEQRARTLTEVHANTPSIAHLDALGRTFLAIADNGGGTTFSTRTKLDIEGRPLEITDALNRVAQTYKYTIAGLILVESNIDSGDRYHLTDVRNLPYLWWDGAGAAIGIGYDVARRIYYISDGSAFLELNVYGEALSSPATTNARKQKIATYDQSGLLKTDSFDFKGNLLSSTKRLANNWQTTVNWAPLYGLTDPAAIEAAAASLLEATTYTETRAYDALNRVTSATTPDVSETRPQYNEAGLLEKVDVRVRGAVGWSPVVDDIDYDAKGQRLFIDYGNGTNTTYTYDPLTFRLTRALTKRESDNATLQDLNYTYDPVGNVLAIADNAQDGVFFGGNFVNADQLFEYDPTYRLTRAEGREHASLDTRPNNADFISTIALPHPNSPQSLRRYVEVFTYNAVGSPTSHAHTPTGGTAWTRAYTYVAGKNQLATTNTTETYTHDGHGNITAMPHLSAITWTTYDQMKSANLGGGGMVYFNYDISGQRVRKVRHHLGGSIVEERIYLGSYEIYRKRVSGVLEVERQTLHLMDGVKRVAMVETKTIDTGIPGWTPVPRWRFQLDNHLGSACLEVTDAGLVFSYEEMHPYGSTAYKATNASVDVSAKRYRYTGKERDEETGFYYHGARYYAAWLGRWVSADPLGIQAGLNLYLYGRASPVTYSDPTGLAGTSDTVDDRRRGVDAPPIGGASLVELAKGAVNSAADQVAEVAQGLAIFSAPLGLDYQHVQSTLQRIDEAEDQLSFGEVSRGAEVAGGVLLGLLTAKLFSPFSAGAEVASAEAAAVRGATRVDAAAASELNHVLRDAVKLKGGASDDLVSGQRALDRRQVRWDTRGARPKVEPKPSSRLTDAKGVEISDKIGNKQGRHVPGHPDYKGRGFVDSFADAQRVLDEFHAGTAKVLGRQPDGEWVVEVKSVTGTHVNQGAGLPNQPSNVFMIKGSTSPSVVPINPKWSRK